MSTICCDDTTITYSVMPTTHPDDAYKISWPPLVEAQSPVITKPDHLNHSNFYGNIDHIPPKWWEIWK